MYNHSDTLLKLRERIAKKAKEWLSKNIFEYLPLQADLCDLSPDIFIQVKQYKKFKSKQLEIFATGLDRNLKDDYQIELSCFKRKWSFPRIELAILRQEGNSWGKNERSTVRSRR